MSHNSISDIQPIANLSSLTHIFLVDNNISDISPISGLKKISELHLFENPLCNSTTPNASHKAELDIETEFGTHEVWVIE